MTVNDWQQQGRIYLWRYPMTRTKHAGWHVTADAVGSSSVADLLDRMEAAGAPVLRTLSLHAPSADIAAVPNFGDPAHAAPDKMRLVYRPDDPDLAVSLEEERLVVRFGKARLPDLRSAFVEVGIGGGDFAIWSNTAKGGTPLWFWWLPRSSGHRF